MIFTHVAQAGYTAADVGIALDIKEEADAEKLKKTTQDDNKKKEADLPAIQIDTLGLVISRSEKCDDPRIMLVVSNPFRLVLYKTFFERIGCTRIVAIRDARSACVKILNEKSFSEPLYHLIILELGQDPKLCQSKFGVEDFAKNVRYHERINEAKSDRIVRHTVVAVLGGNETHKDLRAFGIDHCFRRPLLIHAHALRRIVLPPLIAVKGRAAVNRAASRFGEIETLMRRMGAPRAPDADELTMMKKLKEELSMCTKLLLRSEEDLQVVKADLRRERLSNKRLQTVGAENSVDTQVLLEHLREAQKQSRYHRNLYEVQREELLLTLCSGDSKRMAEERHRMDREEELVKTRALLKAEQDSANEMNESMAAIMEKFRASVRKVDKDDRWCQTDEPEPVHYNKRELLTFFVDTPCDVSSENQSVWEWVLNRLHEVFHMTRVMDSLNSLALGNTFVEQFITDMARQAALYCEEGGIVLSGRSGRSGTDLGAARKRRTNPLEEQLKKLTEDLAHSERQRSGLMLEHDKEINSLVEEMTGVQRELHESKKERASLKANLEKVRADYGSMRGARDAAEDEKREADARAVELEKLIAERDTALKVMCNDVAALTGQLEASRAAVTTMTASASGNTKPMMEQLQKVEADLLRATSDLTRERELMSSKTVECESLNKGIAELTKRVAALDAALAKSDEKNLYLEHELEALRGSPNVSLNLTTPTLNLGGSSKKGGTKGNTKGFPTSPKAPSGVGGAVAELEIELARLKAFNKTLMDAKEDLLATVQTTEASLGETTTRLQTALKENLEAQNDIKMLRTELSIARSELSEKSELLALAERREKDKSRGGRAVRVHVGVDATRRDEIAAEEKEKEEAEQRRRDAMRTVGVQHGEVFMHNIVNTHRPLSAQLSSCATVDLFRSELTTNVLDGVVSVEPDALKDEEFQLVLLQLSNVMRRDNNMIGVKHPSREEIENIVEENVHLKGKLSRTKLDRISTRISFASVNVDGDTLDLSARQSLVQSAWVEVTDILDKMGAEHFDQNAVPSTDTAAEALAAMDTIVSMWRLCFLDVEHRFEQYKEAVKGVDEWVQCDDEATPIKVDDAPRPTTDTDMVCEGKNEPTNCEPPLPPSPPVANAVFVAVEQQNGKDEVPSTRSSSPMVVVSPLVSSKQSVICSIRPKNVFLALRKHFVYSAMPAATDVGQLAAAARTPRRRPFVTDKMYLYSFYPVLDSGSGGLSNEKMRASPRSHNVGASASQSTEVQAPRSVTTEKATQTVAPFAAVPPMPGPAPVPTIPQLLDSQHTEYVMVASTSLQQKGKELHLTMLRVARALQDGFPDVFKAAVDVNALERLARKCTDMQGVMSCDHALAQKLLDAVHRHSQQQQSAIGSKEGTAKDNRKKTGGDASGGAVPTAVPRGSRAIMGLDTADATTTTMVAQTSSAAQSPLVGFGAMKVVGQVSTHKSNNASSEVKAAPTNAARKLDQVNTAINVVSSDEPRDGQSNTNTSNQSSKKVPPQSTAAVKSTYTSKPAAKKDLVLDGRGEPVVPTDMTPNPSKQSKHQSSDARTATTTRTVQMEVGSKATADGLSSGVVASYATSKKLTQQSLQSNEVKARSKCENVDGILCAGAGGDAPPLQRLNTTSSLRSAETPSPMGRRSPMGLLRHQPMDKSELIDVGATSKAEPSAANLAAAMSSRIDAIAGDATPRPKRVRQNSNVKASPRNASPLRLPPLVVPVGQQQFDDQRRRITHLQALQKSEGDDPNESKSVRRSMLAPEPGPSGLVSSRLHHGTTYDISPQQRKQWQQKAHITQSYDSHDAKSSAATAKPTRLTQSEGDLAGLNENGDEGRARRVEAHLGLLKARLGAGTSVSPFQQRSSGAATTSGCINEATRTSFEAETALRVGPAFVATRRESPVRGSPGPSPGASPRRRVELPEPSPSTTTTTSAFTKRRSVAELEGVSLVGKAI
eukprot:PhM_4_TR1359/c0_g1_i1/m.44045